MGPLEHPHTLSILTVMIWDLWGTLTFSVYLQLLYGAAGTPSHFYLTYGYAMGPLEHPLTFSVLTIMLWDRLNTLTILVYLQLCYATAVKPSQF
jgi:hypothetical protein